MTLAILIAASVSGSAFASGTKEGTASPAGSRVLLLPYQPIFRSVPPDKATRATEFLLTELQKREALQVVRGGIAVEHAPTDDADPVKAAVEEAEKSEAAKDIVSALTARARVIEKMEADPSRLDDAADYARAHHLLARAQAWAGRDEDAKRTLTVAVGMSPTLPLAPDRFSRLYRRWVTEAASRIAQEKTGGLLVKSVLPGATVLLDGREMGVAPVSLQKVPPGKHVIGARVEGVPNYRAIVEVKAGTSGEFRASFGGTVGGAAVGEVNDAISMNGLPATAVNSAVKAGKDVEANYVIAGGMSQEEDHFNVHTFVVDVSRAKVQPLDRLQLDLDLLTAEADVFRLAQQVERAVTGFSGAQPMVASIEERVQKRNPVSAVDARPDFDAASSRGRKAVPESRGPRKVIRVLQSGSVKIKDEE